MKNVFICLIFLFICSGCAKNTMQEIEIEAEKSAIYDAEKDVSSKAWITYGASCNIVSVIHAFRSEPKIPIDRFLGKPPEYIQNYTTSYNRHAKTKIIQSSITGALGNSFVISMILLVR